MSLLLPHDDGMIGLELVRSVRFRLRPRAAQHLALEQILEGQRLLYNAALQERIDAWRKQRLSITCYEQMKSLTVIRRDDPAGYGALPTTLSRATLRRLDEAFRGFFRRVKSGQAPGFPRFKPMTRWESFGFAEFKGVSFDGRRLRFKGMPGGLRAHVHRELPQDARFLSCQLRRDAKGWSVSLQFRSRRAVMPHRGGVAGMDVGVYRLAVLSDGTVIENARVAAGRARQLRRSQRALERTRKGSGNRAKRRRAFARAHLAIANARETYLHQQSARTSRSYSAVVVENLQIQKLSASAKGTIQQPGTHVRAKAGLNRSIQDAAWGRLLDRDLNAARNILHRGLAMLEQENSAARATDRGVVAPGRLNAGAVTASVPAEKSN